MNRDLIKKIPLFDGLSEADLDELIHQHLQRMTIAPHETIFWMDEPGEELFIIESGRVHISHPDEKGQNVTLAKLSPGAFFGELSLLDGGPHTATARALTHTVLLTLSRSSFYLFLEKHPQLSRTLLGVLSARLRSASVKMRNITNVNEQLEEDPSSFRHLVDKAARVVASSAFLTASAFFILGWIVVQTWLYKKTHHATITFLDRPPTFFLLGFLLALTSFLLTILVLTSQRRLAERDRIRGEIEYQVNVKAQAEIMKLQLKIDKMIEWIHQYTQSEPPPDEAPDA